MAIIIKINSANIYTNEQKDEPLSQSNPAQEAEAASEISVEPLVNQLATIQAQFQALNNNDRDQSLVKTMSEIFINAQTSIDLIRVSNTEIQMAQANIDQGKDVLKGLIKNRSDVSAVNTGSIATRLETAIQTEQSDATQFRQALAEIDQEKRELIAGLDAQIQDQEDRISRMQTIYSTSIQARAKSLATFHSALQAVKENLDQFVQG